jgi:hypothetical protein
MSAHRHERPFAVLRTLQLFLLADDAGIRTTRHARHDFQCVNSA